MTLIYLQGHISYFCLKISVAYFSSLWQKVQGMKDDIAGDLQWPLKVVLGTVNGFILRISKIQHNVTDNGRTSAYI